ncbi:hypothetical protein LG047_02085 [Methylocystis sp. WRRC1]|uniref:hypothetical protein n=1 Tax=unclassified Methylocystis TaxID=2625913 RepID=UPI0001F867C5|nr:MULTISPECIES: hypothetical protein [unclassified Methylocystis]MCC3244120.1 hypothetical protein [Methylocystis sp. WRRC1]
MSTKSILLSTLGAVAMFTFAGSAVAGPATATRPESIGLSSQTTAVHYTGRHHHHSVRHHHRHCHGHHCHSHSHHHHHHR